MKLQPTDAILAVNHRCNTFCAMCDIWSKPDRNELEPEFYRRLPRSLRNINISGGEPFLVPVPIDSRDRVAKEVRLQQSPVGIDGVP